MAYQSSSTRQTPCLVYMPASACCLLDASNCWCRNFRPPLQTIKRGLEGKSKQEAVETLDDLGSFLLHFVGSNKPWLNKTEEDRVYAGGCRGAARQAYGAARLRTRMLCHLPTCRPPPCPQARTSSGGICGTCKIDCAVPAVTSAARLGQYGASAAAGHTADRLDGPLS